MNRKEYLEKAFKLGLCSGALFLMPPVNLHAEVATNTTPAEELEKIKQEKEFIQNWLSDLLDTIEKEVDEKTRVKLYEGCGRGCFNRFQFKKDIALKGHGSLEKLLEAYKQNFEVWCEGNTVHIRYGETSSGCYCPAAKFRPAKPNDKHCECTRTTHQTIFETALNRPFKVDILESVRRGGKTCHFLVHLS
jgi:hypothetical protein